MKIHVNSLNNILQRYISETVLPKYISLWKESGESTGKIGFKVFGIVSGSKLLLKGQLDKYMPNILMLADKDGYLDIDVIKETLLNSIKYVRDSNMSITIPGIEWNLDEEDINDIYQIAKDFVQE